MNELITKDLANEVRLLWSNLTIDFGEEEIQEIVPIKLTHFYLINNLEIPQIIIDYYYYPTRKLISEKEFIQMVKTGYVGNKNRTLTPYSIKMFGAYFRRTSMYYKLIRLSSKNNDLLINGYEIKYYIDLKPYFKEYAIGFRTGFNDFENDCIKPFLFEFSEKTDTTQKIFEFVINKKNIEQCWLNYLVGFTTNYNSKEIVGALKEGKTQGYFYKAWSIIFSNFNLFEPLFMEHKKKAYLSEKTKLNIHKKEPQQENNKAEKILHEIWLPTAKITVKDFLEKGKDLGLWNSDLNLTQQRGAKLYGSGKILLASLAGALKNYAIMESLDYKIIGKAFCKAFNIDEKKGVQEHYKSFNNYNDKYRKEFIRAFNIKL
ncbi:hypothetical protein [Tenacibaculum finnmarkense]|uniref:hypothetical protein n=1 Tax=Tenacibaculum finnmarkense TaxID=2781243 RepID=UPI001E496D78|nr:hypothetical protein [Tenacibaculum finnmarkense]MCD8435919.1 hypothetical protein [Tenacibaculum dicentrarchi]MCG8238289.1 hypothetical protein [Tenacibaculum finnmarkense genomovar ulcerans]